MPRVLITGANRGIGLEFARQYADAGWDVLATARQSSSELDALGVAVMPLDLADADAVVGFSVGGPLHLLIANAATNHPRDAASAEDARAWQEMMMINAIAPYLLGMALLPRMVGGSKMIAITSGMGSIAENSGSWIPYRTSKAALNMAWTSLALEAKPRGVTAAVLSPGWVQTRMGGAGADLTPEESVSAMRALIDRLTIEDAAKFLRRDGSEFPW